MAIQADKYFQLLEELKPYNAQLIAVSKTKPCSDIQAYYDLGQRDFGENYVQEFLEKVPQLPSHIRWHFIGHLQRNKVRQILPHVYLIHGVDSERLLSEIQKEAAKANLKIKVLLQVFVAQEETKFGFDQAEFSELLSNLDQWPNVDIMGVMGMSSLTENTTQIRSEFQQLKQASQQLLAVKSDATQLSMGMSGDYTIALEEGSTMVRIGSVLFGARDYSAK
jgi:pyridoxal phosphate enzyme (YggS family)